MSPVLGTLYDWLDSWSGIGVIERGRARQGYDLQRYANEGWRARFYVAGSEHSMTQVTGSAWEPPPWRAVQGGRLGRIEEAWKPRAKSRATHGSRIFSPGGVRPGGNFEPPGQ